MSWILILAHIWSYELFWKCRIRMLALLRFIMGELNRTYNLSIYQHNHLNTKMFHSYHYHSGLHCLPIPFPSPFPVLSTSAILIEMMKKLRKTLYWHAMSHNTITRKSAKHVMFNSECCAIFIWYSMDFITSETSNRWNLNILWGSQGSNEYNILGKKLIWIQPGSCITMGIDENWWILRMFLSIFCDIEATDLLIINNSKGLMIYPYFLGLFFYFFQRERDEEAYYVC